MQVTALFSKSRTARNSVPKPSKFLITLFGVFTVVPTKTALSFRQPPRILKPDEPNPRPPTNIYLISILILSSHLRLCVLSGLFQLYTEKLSTNFSSTPHCHKPRPLRPAYFHTNIICWPPQICEAPHYTIFSCLLLRTNS